MGPREIGLRSAFPKALDGLLGLVQCLIASASARPRVTLSCSAKTSLVAQTWPLVTASISWALILILSGERWTLPLRPVRVAHKKRRRRSGHTGGRAGSGLGEWGFFVQSRPRVP